MIYDDGSSFPESDVTWTIRSGPVADISATGLATAAAVYQDTPAIIRGGSTSFTDELTLTILDIDSDNFATYAADGLPDQWQVQYFGIEALKAGKFDDFDGDGVENLIDWSNATTPLTVIADDGTFEVVSVRFPVLIGGRRSSSQFFRLNVITVSPWNSPGIFL